MPQLHWTAFSEYFIWNWEHLKAHYMPPVQNVLWFLTLGMLDFGRRFRLLFLWSSIFLWSFSSPLQYSRLGGTFTFMKGFRIRLQLIYRFTITTLWFMIHLYFMFTKGFLWSDIRRPNGHRIQVRRIQKAFLRVWLTKCTRRVCLAQTWFTAPRSDAWLTKLFIDFTWIGFHEGVHGLSNACMGVWCLLEGYGEAVSTPPTGKVNEFDP